MQTYFIEKEEKYIIKRNNTRAHISQKYHNHNIYSVANLKNNMNFTISKYIGMKCF